MMSILYYNEIASCVENIIGSSFKGYGDSLGKLEETLKILNTLKLIQLSLDTPNIN